MPRKANRIVMKRRYTKAFRDKPPYKRKSKYKENYICSNM